MKKIKIVLIAIFLITATLLCCSCGSKTPQTPDGFKEVLSNEGFEIIDLSGDVEEDSNIDTLLYATNDNYTIEYGKMTDVDSAKRTYAGNKEYIESLSSSLYTYVSVGNHSIISCTSEGTFYIISRIDDTILYCEAAGSYKDEIEEIFKTLGYK